MVAPELYEIILIKAETPVNLIASTKNKLRKILTPFGVLLEFSKKEKVRLHTEKLNKLRRAKDERNARQSLPVTLRSRGQLVSNYLKQHSNITSWNKQGQIIYKDDDVKNSNMIDLLAWMIKLKSNNTNKISLFGSSLFAKAIAECNSTLEWIQKKDMLTMVKMVEESDEELMQDTSIASRKLLEKPNDEIKWEEFKHYKRPRKKIGISSMEKKKYKMARISKKNTLFTSVFQLSNYCR